MMRKMRTHGKKGRSGRQLTGGGGGPSSPALERELVRHPGTPHFHPAGVPCNRSVVCYDHLHKHGWRVTRRHSHSVIDRPTRVSAVAAGVGAAAPRSGCITDPKPPRMLRHLFLGAKKRSRKHRHSPCTFTTRAGIEVTEPSAVQMPCRVVRVRVRQPFGACQTTEEKKKPEEDAGNGWRGGAL